MKRSIIYKVVAIFDGVTAIYAAFIGDTHFIAFSILAGISWALSESCKTEEDKQGE